MLWKGMLYWPVEPRSWKPQPATVAATRTAASVRTTMVFIGLHHDVDEFARHDDDLLRRAFDELADRFLGQRSGFDRRLVGILRYLDRAAQLAVHLDHQLD